MEPEKFGSWLRIACIRPFKPCLNKLWKNCGGGKPWKGITARIHLRRLLHWAPLFTAALSWYKRIFYFWRILYKFFALLTEKKWKLWIKEMLRKRLFWLYKYIGFWKDKVLQKLVNFTIPNLEEWFAFSHFSGRKHFFFTV